MTQVIDFIGGEYRNRTGVHGFARVGMWLKNNGKMIRGLPKQGGTMSECLDAHFWNNHFAS